MAGLRMVWIDEANAQTGAIAKRAYRRLGEWAFAKTQQWIDIIQATDAARCEVIASRLTTSFQLPVGDWPPGAPNPNPRVVILYENVGPASTSAADVAVYHAGHEIRIQQDTAAYSWITFEGDPLVIDFQNYMLEYVEDDDETLTPAKKLRRAKKQFALMLMTKCR
jgi:hypothetical protein